MSSSSLILNAKMVDIESKAITAKRNTELFIQACNDCEDSGFADLEFISAVKKSKKKIEDIIMNASHVTNNVRLLTVSNPNFRREIVILDNMANVAFNDSKYGLDVTLEAVAAAKERNKDKEPARKKAKQEREVEEPGKKKAREDEARNKPGGSNA